jgi:hypothetical protein
MMAPVPETAWGDALRLKPAAGPGHGLSLNLSTEFGAIVSLIECSSAACDGGSGQRQWASVSQPLGRFVYRSRSYEAGVGYYAHYQYVNAGWGPRVYEVSNALFTLRFPLIGQNRSIFIGILRLFWIHFYRLLRIGKRIVPSLDAWQFLIKTTMAFQDMIMTKM